MHVALRAAAGGLARLLTVWLLAYVLLLQSVLGAAAMAGASGPGAADGLCLPSSSAPDDTGSAPHDGAGLHCAVCPAAGGVAPLPCLPALPLPVPAATAEAPVRPAARPVGPAPRHEQARPRAPPVA